MAINSLIFKDAEKARDAILDSQKKEIQALYEKWADEIADKANYYARKTNPSAAVSEQQMKQLYKQLKETSKEVSNEVYNKIKNNLYLVADATVKSNTAWLASLGFDEKSLSAAFSNVPDAMVRNLVTGQIYESGWSLSKRIWSDNEQALKDIYQVVAQGVAENKSIYDIAKNLEAYVRPSARLPWNLRMADGARIYKKQVDYNAQRLARTLVQHGYQQSFIATTQKNPFITEYVWHSNGSRVCEICMARDGKHFKKDELPMDHPNGMCTMEPVVVNDITDQLADWFNSPDGTYPEIDEFANNFGYKASKAGTVSDFIGKYGTSTKSPNAWFNGLTPIQKAEAKALKDQSGLTWNKWYEKNVYVGDGQNLATKKKAVTEVFDKNAWLNDFDKNKSKREKLNDWTNEWRRSLSTDEITAVKNYTGNKQNKPAAAYEINKYLRGFASSTEHVSDITLLKSALSKASLPEDIVVNRGAGLNSIINMLELDTYDQARAIVTNKSKYIGSIIEDKGFMSTSITGGFSGSAELVIKLPKGSKSMYINSMSVYTDQDELLLASGSKFILEDIEEVLDIREIEKIPRLYLRMLK